MRLYPRKATHARHKCCAICRENKKVKHFALLGSGQLHAYCHPCLREYMRQRYHYLKKRAVTTLKDLM